MMWNNSDPSFSLRFLVSFLSIFLLGTWISWLPFSGANDRANSGKGVSRADLVTKLDVLKVLDYPFQFLVWWCWRFFKMDHPSFLSLSQHTEYIILAKPLSPDMLSNFLFLNFRFRTSSLFIWMILSVWKQGCRYELNLQFVSVGKFFLYGVPSYSAIFSTDNTLRCYFVFSCFEE